MPKRKHHWLAKARTDLRRLGVRCTDMPGHRLRVGQELVSSSRVSLDGLYGFQVGVCTNASLPSAGRALRLAGELSDRLPIMLVMAGDQIQRVQMPAHTLAALIRMASECDQSKQLTILNEYLQVGASLTSEEKRIATGIYALLDSPEAQ